MKRNYMIKNNWEQLYFEDYNDYIEVLSIDYFKYKHDYSREIINHNTSNRCKDLESYLYTLKVITESNINCIGLKDINKRGKDYHLDHIIPISYGFQKGIDHKLISSKVNLQILTSTENILKGLKITEEAINLLNLYKPIINPIKSKTIFERSGNKLTYKKYHKGFNIPPIKIQDDKFLSVYNLNTAELIKEIKYR